jgi:hypothetical protein
VPALAPDVPLTAGGGTCAPRCRSVRRNRLLGIAVSPLAAKIASWRPASS